MHVPLTLADFLYRAETVYGAREAIVDEPDPPGGGVGHLSYSQLGEMSRSLAAALDEMGVEENARVAIISPNSARFLVSLFGVSAYGRVLVPVNFRLNERGEPIPGRGRTRVVVAGAPPPSRTIERVETELAWEFIQIYGLTETSPLLTINRAPAEWDGLDPADRASRLSRAGVPAVGVRMTSSPSGEILARSNHVFDGYYAQPEDTGKAIVDGWFHTGDGGHLEGAYTVITDRKKDVIITGGENVSSIEVEDCLYQHPAIAQTAVIGVPHEKWGETVLAFVVARAGIELTPQEVIDHCREKLAHYKCPTVVEMRESLPRTATGKLQKFKLREPYWAGRARGVN